MGQENAMHSFLLASQVRLFLLLVSLGPGMRVGM